MDNMSPSVSTCSTLRRQSYVTYLSPLLVSCRPTAFLTNDFLDSDGTCYTEISLVIGLSTVVVSALLSAAWQMERGIHLSLRDLVRGSCSLLLSRRYAIIDIGHVRSSCPVSI